MNINKCDICPHECKVNRKNQIGRCKATDKVKIALSSLHFFEEPCISGKNGSGTIFFSNCNLRCVFCQNHKISHEGYGVEVNVERLAEIMIEQQKNNANNINLVSPTIYAYQIKQAIILAKQNGLKIPIIYNSSGYEKVETLKELEGLIDVYLPDFKYSNNEIALKYSGIKNYYDICLPAIKEMYRQVGTPKLNENGIIEKGLIIRHLILPNNIENTKRVIDSIKLNFSNDIYVSMMAQYFPTYKAKEIPEINRKISKEEYEEIENYIFEKNIENGYMQDLGKHEEEYVPEFNLSGV
ncbi:MAG: radical SAM protein [Clostridia bacterium]|nr:radical SAM protein [Clostridia bacterium]